MSSLVEVAADDVPRLRAFFEAHLETSLFPLSNLDRFGHRPGAQQNSGSFHLLVEGETVRAACGLTNRDILLIQTGGRAALAEEVVEGLRASGRRIAGVLGAWDDAAQAFARLREQPGFVERLMGRERLYRLALPAADALPRADAAVRRLVPEDFDTWRALQDDYLEELGLGAAGTVEARRLGFDAKTRLGEWWALEVDGEMRSIGAYNARYRHVAQVGGVYTPPAFRRQGLARRVMDALVRDSVAAHGVDTLVLFTGEDNVAAQDLYEQMGFARRGAFGMCFGTFDTPDPDA